MTTNRIPALHELSEDGRRIVLWYSERARSEGWLSGYDHAVRSHWNLPSYEGAVDALIDLGTLAINRAESARRQEVAK